MRQLTIGLLLAIATAAATQSAAWSFEFKVPTHPTASEVSATAEQQPVATPQDQLKNLTPSSSPSTTMDVTTYTTNTSDRSGFVRYFNVPTHPTASAISVPQ